MADKPSDRVSSPVRKKTAPKSGLFFDQKKGNKEIENWLAVVSALDNMIGKNGQNYPGPFSISCSLLLKHRMLSALYTNIKRSALELSWVLL